jgi:hypothetical protein
LIVNDCKIFCLFFCFAYYFFFRRLHFLSCAVAKQLEIVGRSVSIVFLFTFSLTTDRRKVYIRLQAIQHVRYYE